MQLFTAVSLPKLALISRDHSILTLGSCFSDHIGQKFLAAKWSCVCNPFGTLYHPLAITRLLELVTTDQELPEDGFVEREGGVFHYDLPATLYGLTREELRWRVRKLGEDIRQVLNRPGWLLLTLGTAQVYRHRDLGRYVANCHQQAGHSFTKHLLSLEEIQTAWQACAAHLPGHTQVIWTLSPVRHTRETLQLNMVSKSILRLWIHQSLAQGTGAWYFPAYEIMLDELRDYRYYADDLIHPRDSTVSYLWEKFCESYLDPEAQDFLARWEPFRQRLLHRPLRPETPSHRQFLLETLRCLDQFQDLDTTDERQMLEGQLAGLERLNIENG
jgi:hypothetical protein